MKDIAVKYGRNEALKGVTLSIEQGAIVGLIGANGAGKTTTLNSISGLLKLSSGEIWFDGERIDGESSTEIVRKGIALVPQAGRPFPRMSVRENLLMGAYVRKDQQEIERDLQRVYEHFPILADRQRQKAGTLSGGERQMLCIGRGMMSSPKLLMMDEPSHGLAPKAVAEIAHIIRRINAAGTSILLVEQNARLALSVASSAFCLETGNVCIEGPCAALQEDDAIRAAYLGV